MKDGHQDTATKCIYCSQDSVVSNEDAWCLRTLLLRIWQNEGWSKETWLGWAWAESWWQLAVLPLPAPALLLASQALVIKFREPLIQRNFSFLLVYRQHFKRCFL